MEYDGSFVCDSKRIDYCIIDGSSVRTVEGKMSRGIQFYLEDHTIGYKSIYGTDEEMTNISNADAEKWYIKMING